jgi:nuclear pore complex protein Nup133
VSSVIHIESNRPVTDDLDLTVTVGKVNHAYELAERHRDFRALVELCNHPQHGSRQRIQFFMDKYREEFAFSLYQFYIEKSELRCRTASALES